MTTSLPAFMRAILTGGPAYIVEETNYRCPSCTCKHHSFKEGLHKLHTRPLFVISSTEFDSLEEAEEQLSEWFVDDTLDSLTAVYRVLGEGKEVYVVSSTELDTEEEAKDQLIEWHNLGMLHKKARVYETSLANTYEIKPTLVKASRL